MDLENMSQIIGRIFEDFSANKKALQKIAIKVVSVYSF